MSSNNMSLNWQRNRRLSEFSTFGIGGPISLFAKIATAEEMEEAFAYASSHNLRYFILGKGSNCLFDDAGFDGIVLQNRIDFVSWEGKARVTAGAGANFSLLGFKTASQGLSGLEFASGIPASVGGAVFMNAGANGKETCQPLSSVLYLDAKGGRREFSKEELKFGYRSSPFQKMSGAILSATFELEAGSAAREKQLEIVNYRIKTQPGKEKSAGCVFRNPAPNLSAGALIERSGLKGLRVGGAEVSKVHANFLINRDDATAKDVLSLIAAVQEEVHRKTGVHLEPEIRIIGHSHE
jgi:UDP-N-acetylmuramate dehydrogenase